MKRSYKKAVRFYKAAAELWEGDFEGQCKKSSTLFNCANCLDLCGEPQEAVEAYHGVIRIYKSLGLPKSEWEDCLRNLAITLRAMGDTSGAANALRGEI